jgi:L-lactate dehydrogenase (cytochrome)
LSTLATRSIEEVARAAPTGHHWFQVYVWRDRGLVFELIDRAHASGYEALMVTVDTPVFGRRLRDVRRGFQLPPTIGPATLADGLAHPAWTWRLLSSEPIGFANVRAASVGDGSTPVSLADYINGQFDPSFDWDDIAELRTRWRGPLVLKGIQTDEDALLARDVGADAVVVSNHGGRQLDGAPATLEMLPAIKEAIGDELEVFLDGGIRRGSDIVKALALGANMCLIGRAYLYGLATAGQAGVGFVLALLDADVRRTLALMGLTSLEQLTPEMVRRR